ncbi:MAG TPA: hypothetical protein VK530_12140 [Candidatus Acidoferrum sp.]|nr:hypothetical protein [Candidatus Acidoferrum sp.]
MNDDCKRPWRTALIALIVVPFIYVLSIGPVAKLHSKGMLSSALERVAWDFYSPLGYIVGKNAAMGNFYLWYCCTIWRIPKPN